MELFIVVAQVNQFFQNLRIDSNKCERNKSGNILLYINITIEESIIFENMIFSNLKSTILFCID